MDVARYTQELYWHLNPKKIIDKIYIPLSSKLYTLTEGGKRMPPIAPNFFDADLFGDDFYNSDMFEFFEVSNMEGWQKSSDNSSILMISDIDRFKQLLANDHPIASFLYGKELLDMNHNKSQFALYDFLHMTNRHTKNFPEIIESSKNILRKIKPELETKNKMYLFGSGPSVSSAFEFDFSDGTTVICNSTIADDELINHIKPNFIACIDMLLHAGCSKYASAYRKKLIDVMEKHHSYLLTRTAFYDIMKQDLPNYLSDRIISIPEHPPWIPYNIDLNNKLYAIDTGNVLTMTMLPFAASFAKEINVIGMDGKAPDDEEFLWHYYKTDTLKPYMKHIAAAYPAYYYRDNTSYIASHERNLENIINVITNQGIEVKSLTKSYLAAFADKYVSTI
jgi:hypothetical protein